MAKTGLRAAVGTTTPKIGTFVFEFAVPGIGQVLGAAGAEFVVIDMEHSGFGFDAVRAGIKYMQAGNLPVVVRAPSKAYDHIARIMDIGADGVMVPMVSSVEQARSVLDAVKYFPQGKRGVALGLAMERYSMTGASLAERFAAQNDRTIVMLQIEDPAGAGCANEMAAMDGVDVLWIGHNDLSVAMGIPGAFDDQRFQAHEGATIAACRKHGKSAGRLARDAEEAASFVARGFDFISIATDVALLQQAMSSGIARVRGAR